MLDNMVSYLQIYNSLLDLAHEKISKLKLGLGLMALYAVQENPTASLLFVQICIIFSPLD